MSQVEQINTDLIVSMTDLTRSPSTVIDRARREKKAIAIMSHSKFAGYFVPSESISIDESVRFFDINEDEDFIDQTLNKHQKNIRSLANK